MPYVDKILKAEYQKRTASPYMKKWREKNRERHRKYIREWARKRRMNKQKNDADNKKKKAAPSYKLSLKTSKYRSAIAVAKLQDCYIVSTLTKHSKGMLNAKTVRQYPEIIEHQKKIIQTKRLLKYANAGNKQL